MTYDFNLDPSGILGVAANASLLEIRAGYLEKSKKHHPDHGGDEWAFRVVQRAYEILSTARVVGRVSEEVRRSQAGGASGRRTTDPGPGAKNLVEQVRAGVTDRDIELSRLVDVELFCLRFEIDNSWTVLNMKSAQQRNLSCCLNVNWPSKELDALALAVTDTTEILGQVRDTFAILHTTHPAREAQATVEDDHFDGWASYDTATQAYDAFQILRNELRNHGLGVKQWSREIVLPQEWR